jgi:hypothetical protein
MQLIRTIRDQLTETRITLEAGASRNPEAGLSREEILGLKYRPGQRTIDPVTGKEVTVIGSTRIAVKVSDTGGGR